MSSLTPYRPIIWRDLGMQPLKDPDELERMEVLLEGVDRNAEKIKRQVEEWLVTISPRMQRIIRYRIFEELTGRR